MLIMSSFCNSSFYLIADLFLRTVSYQSLPVLLNVVIVFLNVAFVVRSSIPTHFSGIASFRSSTFLFS